MQLFGAAAYVAASAAKSRKSRVIGRGPLAGQTFPVSVPTHISANLGFASGQSATSVYSFDSPLSRILLELTGTDATLAMPDPNTFGGDLLICRRGGEWRTLESTQAVSARGTGVLEMARALRENRPHRATGVLAGHVLDIMLATVEAA